MKKLVTSLHERWLAGERSPATWSYGMLAAPASLAFRLLISVHPPLSRQFVALQHSRLIVVSSPVAGGVGKTPMTALLADGLKSRGESPAVVTMGYGRRLTGEFALTNETSGVGVDHVGDEAAELQLLTQCPVYVGDEPSETINRIDRDRGSGWIIFDDGVSRTWDRERRVVMLGESDLSRPIRYLPLGAWRVTRDFLRSAAYLAVTTAADSPAIAAHEDRLRQWGYEGEIGWFRYVNGGLHTVDGARPMETPPGDPFVFCGIARQDRFRASVRDAGFSDAHFHAFPDHYRYSHSDWMVLESARRSSGCGWFLTTAKDAVRIDRAWLGSTPLRFLRIALHQIAGTDILTALAKDG